VPDDAPLKKAHQLCSCAKADAKVSGFFATCKPFAKNYFKNFT
jgi:hypothetical protein